LKVKANALLFFLMTIVMIVIIPSYAYATEDSSAPEYDWIEGTGQTVFIGNIADLKLDSQMLYLDKENTARYTVDNGNIASESELASVFPKDANWAVYFQYMEDGHIPDDEKNSIDADALLESYKEGTAARNEQLEDKSSHLFVEGWEAAPRYNETKRALTWAVRMHDGDNNPVVNFNTRILTRIGYMSVLLVTNPDNLQADSADMERLVLSNLSTKAGQHYEDFDESTDKLAEYGLTGLILGGAGLAVAKKAGMIALLIILVKKFWFLVIAAPIAIWRFLRGRQNSRSAGQEAENVTEAPYDAQHELEAARNETAAGGEDRPKSD
jgi:uncharacterized membrane-anchored protein